MSKVWIPEYRQHIQNQEANKNWEVKSGSKTNRAIFKFWCSRIVIVSRFVGVFCKFRKTSFWTFMFRISPLGFVNKVLSESGGKRFFLITEINKNGEKSQLCPRTKILRISCEGDFLTCF